MDSINVSELVERLSSDEDAVRKMAVFKLQSNVGDPSFADIFILENGLSRLRYLVLHATGNTLAYSLTSFSRLLEVDKGWESVDEEMVERVVQLVVTHPLVNILRGAMSILVYIVSHPYTTSNRISQPNHFGFRALKPAIAIHPQFLEMLVTHLSTPDHALCANALQLINSLMREAVSSDSEVEWAKLMKRLQDLGVIEAVFGLMQSNALQDLLQPLLEYQTLRRIVLRKWQETSIDVDNPEHRRGLKTIHALSNPEHSSAPVENGVEEGKKMQPNPEKWRRLGFHSESPAVDFEEVGYLGMLDLLEYVRNNENAFRGLILEQSTQPLERRCPFARASLAVTAAMVEHFEVDKADFDDAKYQLAFESKVYVDRFFKPFLLQWPAIHAAGLQAFFKIWQGTEAETHDFPKIYDLMRILMEAIVGSSARTQDIKVVQKELITYELSKLRQLQMELIEMTYEGSWSQYLRQIKDELSHEALQFVKEQRIRCLLAGAWFPNVQQADETTSDQPQQANSFRFVKLSHNRRYLCYSDFDMRDDVDPSMESLQGKLDLSSVTSVTSNVSAAPRITKQSSTETLRNVHKPSTTSTKITISGQMAPTRADTSSHGQSQGQQNSSDAATASPSHARKHSSHRKEQPLLILHPQTQTLASEWLDGLLMLLNQQPITNETTKLINMIREYGLRIRLLSVRFDDMGMEGPGEGPAMPDREGVDDDFYYDNFGG